MKKIILKTVTTCLFIGLMSTCIVSKLDNVKVEAATKAPVLNQSVTGYFDDLRVGGKNYPANYANSGDYRVGMVAVHPTTYKGTKPYYDYGTILYIDTTSSSPYGDPVPTPLGELTTFQVQDLGDVDYAGMIGPLKYTMGWIDVYCGRAADYGWTDAQLEYWIKLNIGSTKRDYYYWK